MASSWKSKNVSESSCITSTQSSQKLSKATNSKKSTGFSKVFHQNCSPLGSLISTRLFLKWKFKLQILFFALWSELRISRLRKEQCRFGKRKLGSCIIRKEKHWNLLLQGEHSRSWSLLKNWAWIRSSYFGLLRQRTKLSDSKSEKMVLWKYCLILT